MLGENGQVDSLILLARHGQTADAEGGRRVRGWLDAPLAEAGREQARRLAEQLRAEGIAAIWTSHLRRARETAEIVGAALGLEPRVDQRFAESRRGSWEGRLVADIKREQPEAWRAWKHADGSFRFPGGESLEEQRLRVVEALVEVASGALPALVVCHAGTMRCAYAHLHPSGFAAFRELPVEPCSVFRVPAGGLSR